MINLFNTHIENLSIHRVGNKSRNEAIFLSEQPYTLNDEIVPLLKEYFLSLSGIKKKTISSLPTMCIWITTTCTTT